MVSLSPIDKCPARGFQCDSARDTSPGSGLPERNRRHQTCDLHECATSAPAELGGETHNVSRSRACTQVLLRVRKLLVCGSGTFGAFWDMWTPMLNSEVRVADLNPRGEIVTVGMLGHFRYLSQGTRKYPNIPTITILPEGGPCDEGSLRRGAGAGAPHTYTYIYIYI